MATFNNRRTQPLIKSPVTTDGTTKTFEGAAGYRRTPLSDLYLLSVSNLVTAKTFYEGADPRNERYVDLLKQVALLEQDEVTAMLPWLRSEGYMRTASVLGAAEVAKTLCDQHRYKGVEDMVDGSLQRADELGEYLAYWFSIAGKAWPKRYRPVKRGLARAATRLYNEFSYGKWDSDKREIRFADVIEIVHPHPRGGVEPDVSCPTPEKAKFATREAAPKMTQKGDFELRSYLCKCGWIHVTKNLDAEQYQVFDNPEDSWQSNLFRLILDRRHGHKGTITENLPMLRALRDWRVGASLMRNSEAVRTSGLLDADAIKAAGLTWEDILSELGGRVDKKILWEAATHIMAPGALLDNLRNFDENDISNEAANRVARVLTDPERVRRARLFPYSFLAAYRAVSSLNWGHVLEKGLRASLENVPELRGKTLILVDRSPSMFPGYEGSTPNSSSITLADQAALFGASLAVKAQDATLVEFGGDDAAGRGSTRRRVGSRRISVPRGASVLKLVESFGDPISGTDIPRAVKDNFTPEYDRVVIVTDEQSRPGMLPSNMERFYGMPETSIDDLIPATVPVYMWNMAGYLASVLNTSGTNRHCFGGLSDVSFKLISMLERRKNVSWPWHVPQENAVQL